MARYYFSPTKQKTLLLLLAGVTISLSRSSRDQWRIIRNLPKIWKAIDRAVLYRIMREFYRDRLVDVRYGRGEEMTMVLTERGRKRALRYKISELSIPTPLRWDKKWRIIIFDIPEKRKGAREVFRQKIAELGFVQFQKSAGLFPYPCRDILGFITEVFELRPFVQYIEASYVSNDAKMRLYFKLPA